MLIDDELLRLDDELLRRLRDVEADHVERTAQRGERHKVGEAICAFANDLPDRRDVGVLFVGVHDDGRCAGLTIDDDLAQWLLSFADDGQTVPLPVMTVRKVTLDGCDVAVVEVSPSDSPPVKYKGRTCVRRGPRRGFATPEEERRLAEKRRRAVLPFDQTPLPGASLADLDLLRFEQEYLPAAVAPDVLAENGRSREDQMRSLRLLSPDGIPTLAGLLVLGRDPRNWCPGAYIQLVRYAGTEITETIRDQKEIDGTLGEVLRRLDEVIEANIAQRTDLSGGTTRIRPDFPPLALKELARNAVIHCRYEATNAPVRLTWFDDRVEITSPGGPFGHVTVENFGRDGFTDYRNPVLAEAAKTLGYIQRFGSGIPRARKALSENGNPPPEFRLEADFVHVTVRSLP